MDDYETPYDALSDVIRRYYMDKYIDEYDLEALIRDFREVLGEKGWDVVIVLVREQDTMDALPDYYYVHSSDFRWSETYDFLVGLLERIKHNLVKAGED